MEHSSSWTTSCWPTTITTTTTTTNVLKCLELLLFHVCFVASRWPLLSIYISHPERKYPKVRKHWRGRYCIIQGLPLIHIRQMRPELSPQTSILMRKSKVSLTNLLKKEQHLINLARCGTVQAHLSDNSYQPIGRVVSKH